ncbi:hypothetical protein PENSPDRAFT_686635 [Peniophora sp. CONT]|nr:hypothetical protein PENSPDRAFT_686635 [Peniophora sp. CONT]
MDMESDPKYAQVVTMMARELKKAEKSGTGLPAHFRNDLGPTAQCFHCNTMIQEPQKPQLCSACRSVTYCSKECQKKSWKYPVVPRAPTHKETCPDNKLHMLRLPVTQAVIKQFPWGRIEPDGTFNLAVAKARFDVFGGTGTGFWSHRISRSSHQDERYMHGKSSQTFGAKHLDGSDLLQRTTHFNDKQGWKLEPELIPFRDLSAVQEERRPILVTEYEGGVTDWSSWYAWRKLPLESPAALLMDYPLSAYRLITHTLGLTTSTAGDAIKRVPLNIHVLGAEVELNFLPLYSELALLLPYHDINLTFFGYGPRQLALASAAKVGVADSPARRTFSDSNTPVFEHTAPESLGSGSIKIFLHGESDSWTAAFADQNPPDALIASNAGLGSYAGWIDVVRTVHLRNIPFGVTEYAEQSAETQTRASIPGYIAPMSPRAYTIELNPFHKPGQRWMPRIRLPNLYNGFCIKIIGKGC